MHDIFTREITSESDIKSFKDFLDKLKLIKQISCENVFIKPNLMGFFHKDKPTFVCVQLINALGDFLIDNGKKVTIIEADNMMSMVYPRFNVDFLANYIGIKHPIINPSREKSIDFNYEGKIVKMPECLSRDKNKFFLIDFAKFKIHSHFSMTLAMKNMYGVLPEVNKFVQFHRRWNVGKAIASIHHFVQPDYCLIDGIKADGAIEWYGSLDHYPLNMVFACDNPLALDYGIYDLLQINRDNIQYFNDCKWIYDESGLSYRFLGDIENYIQMPNYLSNFPKVSKAERFYWGKVIDKIPLPQNVIDAEMDERLKKQFHDDFLFGVSRFNSLILYHYTRVENYQPIMKEGLITPAKRKVKYISADPESIYLSNFEELIYPSDLEGYNIVIFKVFIPEADFENIYPDEKFINDFKAGKELDEWDEKNMQKYWKESLQKGFGVRFKGMIPITNIFDHQFGKVKEGRFIPDFERQF